MRSLPATPGLLNNSSILSAHFSASFTIFSNALFHAFSYSDTKSPMVSDKSIPPTLPLSFPVSVSSVFGDSWFISSNPIRVLLNFSALFCASCIESSVSSIASPKSTNSDEPCDVSLLRFFNQSAPNNFTPRPVKSLFNAITSPLITGSIFCTTGKNKLPIVLERLAICCLSILNWLAAVLIVCIESVHAILLCWRMAIILNCIFSACVIALTDFVTPFA